MSNYLTVAADRQARMFKALGNPHRLALFLRLAADCRRPPRGPALKAYVGDLAETLDLAPSTVSHHLKELREAGLIRTERDGQNVCCWVDPAVPDALADLFHNLCKTC